jgi:hypothetical protein
MDKEAGTQPQRPNFQRRARASPSPRGEYVFSVAQICNLLYRRIAFCGTSASAKRARTFGPSADYKSAIRQITNLRYEVALYAKHIPGRGSGWVAGLVDSQTSEGSAAELSPQYHLKLGREGHSFLRACAGGGPWGLLERTQRSTSRQRPPHFFNCAAMPRWKHKELKSCFSYF